MKEYNYKRLINKNIKYPINQLVFSTLYSKFTGVCKCVASSLGESSYVGHTFAYVCNDLGIEIPNYIKNCIAETDKYKIKIQEIKPFIYLYYKPINS